MSQLSLELSDDKNEYGVDMVTIDNELLIKTSSILKNCGSKDTISSLFDSNPKWDDLNEAMRKRGAIEGAGQGLKPFYFNVEEFFKFLERYSPNNSMKNPNKRMRWELFKTWAIDNVKDTAEIKYEPTLSHALLRATDCAKMLGIGVSKDWNKFLIQSGALYRVGTNLHAKESEIKAGRFVTKQVPTPAAGYQPQTLVTQKGFKYWSEKYKNR